MGESRSFTVAIGFDAKGYQKAVEAYVAGLVGEKYTQELYDKVIEDTSVMVKDFMRVAEVTITP